MKAMKQTVRGRSSQKSQRSVQYTRHDNKPQKSRGDRVKWTRELQELLQASDQQIVKILIKDKLLKDWTSKPCPHCFEGTCGPLKKAGRRGLVHRCGRKKCHQWVYPTTNHPFFTSGRNNLPLQKQAAVLLMLLAKVSHTSIHKVLGYNHKVMEQMHRKLYQARKKYVEKVEKKIQFGGKPHAWSDVEADEATFGHADTDGDENPQAKVRHWEQWGAIVQRGLKKTLLMKRLRPEVTVRRAPGPGAIKKVDWTPLAEKHLANKRIILHTDSARSYRLHVDGLLHDAVVHKRKRHLVNGKYVWIRPKYTKLFVHKIEGGKTLRVKGGTQVVDRVWRFIKDGMKGQTSNVGSQAMTAKIRSGQWEYWHSGEDLWAATGEMVKSIV